MRDVSKDQWMSANVIFDFLNEPDAAGLTWEGKRLDGKGLGYWYHQVMGISHQINPGALQCIYPKTDLVRVDAG